jgi:hypothetical protein
MNFKQKLQKLYHLQLSINSLTEEVFQKQLSSISSRQPRSKPETPQHSSSKTYQKPSKYSELSKIVLLLQNQNIELTKSIQKNLSTLSELISPLMEKTLSLLVIVHQHLPPAINSEFLSERAELEVHFKQVSNFIRLFSSSFQASEEDSDFERFSTISNRETSLLRIETEDFELQKDLQRYDSKNLENFSDETLQTQQFLKILQSEIECDKNYLNSLAKLYQKAENERKIVQDLKGRTRIDEKIGIVSKIIEEVIEVIKTCIDNKESKVAGLKNVKDFNKSVRIHRRKNPSFEDLEKRFAFSYTEKGFLASSLSNSSDIDKLTLDIMKPPQFATFPDLDDSSSVSSKSFHLKPPRAEDSKNEIQRLKTQIDKMKKDEVNYLEKIENLQKSLARAKNELKVGCGLDALEDLREKIRNFRGFFENQVKSFAFDMKGKVLGTGKELNKKLAFLLKKSKQEIEDLNDNNEGLSIQIEALKDEFQDEVRKINLESQDMKKINRELQNSLKKSNEKIENLQKFFEKVAKQIDFRIDENFEGLQQKAFEMICFVKEVQIVLGEQQLGKLRGILNDLKREEI